MLFFYCVVSGEVGAELETGLDEGADREILRATVIYACCVQKGP